MITNLRTKMVTARKEYRCDYSRQLIKKGDEYQSSVNVYDGEIYTHRTCKEALFLIKELDLYGRGTDNDGFTSDDYIEMLLDYIYDNKLYDLYTEYDGNIHEFVYKHITNKKDK